MLMTPCFRAPSLIELYGKWGGEQGGDNCKIYYHRGGVAFCDIPFMLISVRIFLILRRG